MTNDAFGSARRFGEGRRQLAARGDAPRPLTHRVHPFIGAGAATDAGLAMTGYEAQHARGLIHLDRADLHVADTGYVVHVAYLDLGADGPGEVAPG